METKLTLEDVKAIFNETESSWHGDNVFKGLLLLSTHINTDEKTILSWAGHDEIKSIDVEEAIGVGVTIETFKQLALLNWMVDEYDCLACFV